VKKIFLSYPGSWVRQATCPYSLKIVFHCWIKLLIYRVNICLLWENIECSPLLVTNINFKKLPPFDQRQIIFLQVFIAVVVAYIYKIHCIWLWNTFKILPRTLFKVVKLKSCFILLRSSLVLWYGLLINTPNYTKSKQTLTR
jgi:hypothetical protein